MLHVIGLEPFTDSSVLRFQKSIADAGRKKFNRMLITYWLKMSCLLVCASVAASYALAVLGSSFGWPNPTGSLFWFVHVITPLLIGTVLCCFGSQLPGNLPHREWAEVNFADYEGFVPENIRDLVCELDHRMPKASFSVMTFRVVSGDLHISEECALLKVYDTGSFWIDCWMTEPNGKTIKTDS